MTDSYSSSHPARPAPNVLRQWSAWLTLGLLAIPLMLLAVRSSEIDFRAFYVAAHATASHLDPYADNRLHGEQYSDTATAEGGSRWIYPPAALFFVSPLAWSSYGVARVLFDGLSIAALACMLVSLGRRFKINPLWLALTFVSLPVIACLQRGQIDILILYCVFLSYRFLGRAWAGVPLGVAISIKIFPAAIVLWWLIERRFRDAAVAVGFSLVLAFLAAWRFGLGSYTSFLRNLTTLHAQTASSGTASLSGEPIFSIRQGIVGSYNNPLIYFDHAGIVIGLVLTIAFAIFLWRKQAATEIGFFTMALASQCMNTTLWAMGMVLYIPVCLLAVSRSRSRLFALLLLPLYLPSQIRIFGIAPRFVLALVLIVVAVIRMKPSEDPLAVSV